MALASTTNHHLHVALFSATVGTRESPPTHHRPLLLHPRALQLPSLQATRTPLTTMPIPTSSSTLSSAHTLATSLTASTLVLVRQAPTTTRSVLIAIILLLHYEPLPSLFCFQVVFVCVLLLYSRRPLSSSLSLLYFIQFNYLGGIRSSHGSVRLS